MCIVSGNSGVLGPSIQVYFTMDRIRVHCTVYNMYFSAGKTGSFRSIVGSNKQTNFIFRCCSRKLITFRVSRRPREMYCGHACLCVCLSVCLSAAACPHYCTGPDVTWESGCLLYTSPSPRDRQKSRMPSSA